MPDDALELLAELSDDVCAEAVLDVASVGEELFDDPLSGGGSFDEAFAIVVAFDVLSLLPFRRLLVDSSEELEAASDGSVGNEAETCE